MSGGGGGGQAPQVAPTYVDPVNGMTFTDGGDGSPFNLAMPGSGAAALNAEIASRQAKEKTDSDAKLAQDAADKVTAENTFQGRLSASKDQAGNNARDYFRSQGYDPSLFEPQLANAINTASLGVQDLAPNPMAAFSPNLGANILADANSGFQTRAGNAVNSTFSPTYATDNITSDWLSPASASIMSSQFDPLNAQLTNALKRGTLNNNGYTAAMKALTDAQTTAGSTLNNLGRNILSNDQKGVNDYITGAKNDAANVNASTYGNFDPNKYVSGASDLVNADKGNFLGDLRNALGSTQFSDIGSLLNAGGAVQGATDPTATNPVPGNGAGGAGVSDAYIAQQALANQKRGIGSSGAF